MWPHHKREDLKYAKQRLDKPEAVWTVAVGLMK